MAQSMTGFASKTFILTTPSDQRSTVIINIKSLNSRFFEATVKLPHGLSHLETTIIKLLKKSLRRGHVYVNAYLSNPSIFEGTITPALSTISAYTQAIEDIKKTTSITDSIKLEHILRLPNIFSVEEQQLDEQSNKTILDTIQELIEKVIQTRLQEGKSLVNDLQQRIDIVQQEMKIIEKEAIAFVDVWKKKVHESLQEIGADESLLAEAQKNALYSMLDKIDIHEEITRLNSHLKQFKSHLISDDLEKGKRLDFILQELGREINTIAAKCSQATISSHAINVKVEIEKMREQVQNIV